MTPETAEQLIARVKRLSEEATPVVAWYPHPWEGQVRGPWNRWFQIIGPEEEHRVSEGPHKGTLVRASREADVAYAAAAMTYLPRLAKMVEAARRVIEDWAGSGEPDFHECLAELDRIAGGGA